MTPLRSFSKKSGFGPPLMVRASGGDTKVTQADSLNRRMLFTVFAALLLEMFSRGKIPMTIIFACGLASAMVTVDLIMVLAIAIQLLIPFRRLLLPTQITAVFRFRGSPPCSRRQFTCSALSPPMPVFSHPGSRFCERER